MTAKKRRYWLGLLIAVLALMAIAVALVVSVPARFVYNHYAERIQPLRLQGIEGSVWSGKAAMASYAARPIGPLQWKLDPWSLLRGSAQGTVGLAGPEWTADTQFKLKPGRIELAAARAGFPASMLSPALDIPSLRLLGDIRVDMQDVILENGEIKLAIGQLAWENVGVSGSAEARLGRVIVEFAPLVDGAIVGNVRDDGGPLEARGRIELRGLVFNAEVHLRARPGHEQISEALLYVGERSADGGSLLRVEGTIQKLF